MEPRSHARESCLNPPPALEWNFEQIVKRYQEIGISEIVFFYPFVPMLMPMFEHIVHEAIPRLRSDQPTPELVSDP